MKNSEKVDQFLANNDESTIKDYHDKLFENLTVLNEKEDKLIVWQIVIIFLYLFAGNLKIENLNLGPVSITDTSILFKLIPLVFVYVLYDLNSVSHQKQEILVAFNIISKSRFDKMFKEDDFNNYLTRIYKPYAFTNSISNFIREKANLVEIIFGLLILIPAMLIWTIPFAILFLMIRDVYINHFNDLLDKLSFFVTIWITSVVVYQMIARTIMIYRKEN
ncbi:hypothetical protein [Flavobacterium aquidurense]|uniref:Uncharacterized protein n=1 Tax=Flavobacterium aquidurense TaxID=362413 RepID=A0A0Q0S2P5_9FLAO|nr:hypothetical protein [Flavobacterium aquidurense]KQB39562.1 hypothetical protein RC62_1247 [Flavobacterium aquidurense]